MGKFKYKCIDESDYYKYYAEFQHWALNERGRYLDEMSTKKCIKLFNKKFVSKWNLGKLDEKYYKTFSFLSVYNKQKTRYKWSFEKNISNKEQMTLDLARDTVDNETNDNVICNKVALRFQQRFEQKRQRQKREIVIGITMIWILRMMQMELMQSKRCNNKNNEKSNEDMIGSKG